MTATSFAKGVLKQVIIAKESSAGVKPASTGGRLLRRVNAAPALSKDQIRSQEILTSQQLRDARHGARRVNFPLSGQLAPGSYPEFFEGMLRNSFAAGATTGAQTTIAASNAGTFTRTGGSFITDGFHIGDVVRWTGWASTGGADANNGRNYRITNLTATVMTVGGSGNEAVVTRAAGDSVTCAVVGKRCFIPQSNQVFNTYMVEQYYPDTSPTLSERFLGCTMQSLRLGIAASGICTLDAQMSGLDMEQADAQYFTSAAAQGSANSLTGVSGVLRLGGADVGLVTQAAINISCPVDANPVVGKTTVPAIFPGVIGVDGQLAIYFTDDTFLDLFDNETECDLSILLTSDGTKGADFISLVMNRIKIMGLQKNDSDRSIIQSVSFQALEHASPSSAAYEKTTITVQDSTL